MFTTTYQIGAAEFWARTDEILSVSTERLSTHNLKNARGAGSTSQSLRFPARKELFSKPKHFRFFAKMSYFDDGEDLFATTLPVGADK